MFNIVLFDPEIPPNTGNAIRRAGLDYNEYASVQTYANWQTFLNAHPNANIYALTTRASKNYANTNFKENDYPLFEPETGGFPVDIIERISENHQLRVPMLKERRSLNLSNTVALIIYQAWWQHGFTGGS